MIQRRGGETFLEFRTWHSALRPSALRPSAFRFRYQALLDPKRVIAEIERYGGRVAHRHDGLGLARFEKQNPRICRLVVRWT